MLNLGELVAYLRADFSELEKAEARALKFSQEAVRNFGNVEKAGAKLKEAGKYATGLSIAILGAGAASFGAAKDFGDSFSDVQKSVEGLNSGNISAFKTEILTMGQSSLIGANGVAQLVAEAGKLGESTKGAMEFAKASEQIAVAFDFGQTVEGAKEAGAIIGNLRSSFGIGTKEVLEFADAFNYFGDTTASSSKNITQIMAAQGATVANVTNLTKGELAALAASFDSVAPSAEIAATGMKNMILSMASGTAATSHQAEAFKTLGFDTQELAKRLTTDGAGAIQDILAALANVDDAKKAGLTMQLFGRESIGAISPLIGNLQMLQQNFKNAKDSSKFLGSVKKEYDRLNNADNAKFTKAMNSLQVTMIKIGDIILPIVAQMAVSFSSFLTKVNELDPGLVRIGIGVAGIAALVGPLILGLGVLVSTVGPLVVAAGGFGALLTGIAAAALPVTAALAGLVAAGVLLYQNWDSIKTAAVALAANVMESFNKWKEQNAGLIDSVSAKWATLVEVASALWSAISSAIGGAIQSTITKMNEMLTPIGGLQGAWEIFKEVVGVVATTLLETLGSLFDWTIGKFQGLTEVINGNRSVWNLLGEIIGDVWILIGEASAKGGAMIMSALRAAGDYIKNLDWKDLGLRLMEGLKNGIIAGISSVKSTIVDMGNAVVETAKGVFGIQSPSRVFREIGGFTMSGLAAGIIGSSSLATRAAEDSARQVISAFDNARSYGNGSGFGGSFGANGDDGAIPGFPSISKIAAYHEERLALLQSKGLQETEIFKAIELQKTNSIAEAGIMQVQSYASVYDSILSATKGFAGAQSKVYRGMFAASKAFAIAESVIALQQNIANAMKIGFPQNIPFIAGAVAQGANIVSSIQSVSAPSAGAFYNGGNVPSGMSGVAGEKGVEIVGPAGVMSTQSTKELLGGGGGGETFVQLFIEIVNNSGATVTTEGSGKSEEDKLKIYIDKAVDAVTSKISKGGNQLSRTLESTYRVSRGRG